MTGCGFSMRKAGVGVRYLTSAGGACSGVCAKVGRRKGEGGMRGCKVGDTLLRCIRRCDGDP